MSLEAQETPLSNKEVQAKLFDGEFGKTMQDLIDPANTSKLGGDWGMFFEKHIQGTDMEPVYLGEQACITAKDGDFGPSTNLFIHAFQHLHGLEVDGICGPKTTAYLSQYCAETCTVYQEMTDLNTDLEGFLSQNPLYFQGALPDLPKIEPIKTPRPEIPVVEVPLPNLTMPKLDITTANAFQEKQRERQEFLGEVFKNMALYAQENNLSSALRNGLHADLYAVCEAHGILQGSVESGSHPMALTMFSDAQFESFRADIAQGFETGKTKVETARERADYFENFATNQMERSLFREYRTHAGVAFQALEALCTRAEYSEEVLYGMSAEDFAKHTKEFDNNVKLVKDAVRNIDGDLEGFTGYLGDSNASTIRSMFVLDQDGDDGFMGRAQQWARDQIGIKVDLVSTHERTTGKNEEGDIDGDGRTYLDGMRHDTVVNFVGLMREVQTYMIEEKRMDPEEVRAMYATFHGLAENDPDHVISANALTHESGAKWDIDHLAGLGKYLGEYLEEKHGYDISDPDCCFKRRSIVINGVPHVFFMHGPPKEHLDGMTYPLDRDEKGRPKLRPELDIEVLTGNLEIV